MVEKKQILFVISMIILLLSSIGCLQKNQPVETESKLLTDREQVTLLVYEAVDLIEEKHEEAYSEFRQPSEKWFHDDFFVFVWSIDGVQVVYPPDYREEGKNMKDLKDVNDKSIGSLFIDIAMSEDGEDWVSYEMPKPGDFTPSRTYTLIKRATIDDQIYLVGSSFYVNY